MDSTRRLTRKENNSKRINTPKDSSSMVAEVKLFSKEKSKAKGKIVVSKKKTEKKKREREDERGYEKQESTQLHEVESDLFLNDTGSKC